MQEAFEALREYVEETAPRLDGRLAGVEAALRGTIAHRALVRYDAYNELSGHQSMSIALLDDEHSGIVLSCIHHRDQARVYGKQVHEGRGELELSPEEAEAVRLALADGGGGVTDAQAGRRRCPDAAGRAVSAGARRASAAARRLPRPGGHVQRGGAAGERRARTRSSRCAAASIYETVVGAARRRGRAGRSCRSRTRSRARSA